eukprot:2028975-Rhodomonas_salina.2
MLGGTRACTVHTLEPSLKPALEGIPMSNLKICATRSSSSSLAVTQLGKPEFTWFCTGRNFASHGTQ